MWFAVECNFTERQVLNDMSWMAAVQLTLFADEVIRERKDQADRQRMARHAAEGRTALQTY